MWKREYANRNRKVTITKHRANVPDTTVRYCREVSSPQENLHRRRDNVVDRAWPSLPWNDGRLIDTRKNPLEKWCSAHTKKVTTYLFLAAAARSRWRLFLNQFPTCVGVRPVACASSRFLVGFGYGSCRYHSLSKLRVRSLKQWVFCSPSQIVRGSGNFFRTRYLSTGPVTPRKTPWSDSVKETVKTGWKREKKRLLLKS